MEMASHAILNTASFFFFCFVYQLLSAFKCDNLGLKLQLQLFVRVVFVCSSHLHLELGFVCVCALVYVFLCLDPHSSPAQQGARVSGIQQLAAQTQ